MALSVKAGSFTKSTAAAPAAQAVTGIGFTPKALILFTCGATALNTATAHFKTAIGFTAGASSSGSMAISGQDAVTPTNTSMRAAAKALTIVQYGESLLAECDLTSFDSDGFTLSWTTNDANAYYIGYLALGGSDITGAAVTRWQCTTTGAERAVTGVGFEPTVILDLANGGSGTPPLSAAFAYLTVGAACSDGTSQCCAVAAADAVTTTTSYRSILSQLLSVGADVTGAFFHVDVFKSFDADGFTVFQESATTTYNHYALCLRTIGACAIGTFKPATAAPATHVEKRFRAIWPKAVILMADQKAYHASTGATAPVYFGFGVSDGVSSVAMACSHNYATGAAKAKAVFRDDKAFIKCANDTGTQNAVLDTPTFSANTITGIWSTNDAVKDALAWIAVGDALATNPSQATRLVGGVLA
jgi:hypothetical protein